METRKIAGTCSESPSERTDSRRVICLCCVSLFFVISVFPALSRAQTQQVKPRAGVEPTPEPAVRAILAAFDRYEVIAMPVAHGQKDLDDFILSLIRDPRFSRKVDDIAVECGNSLYQPILDRYTAGEDVPIKDVQKVWRNTTQPACGVNGFYEVFFPLVRAINRKLRAGKHLRVLAGDPPIDWDQVKTFQDVMKFGNRDASIASVMEKEVLAKHRKALMLFGTFHLFHTASAVAMYEKDYPNLTFVISQLGTLDTNLRSLSGGRFARWSIPALAQAKGTWLGALDLGQFFPPPTMMDRDCNMHHEFPKRLQKPMGDLVDAFLYLGPQDLRLWEKTPADVVLDEDYMREWRRRETLPGSPDGTTEIQEFQQQIVDRAVNPIYSIDAKPPSQAELKQAVQSCLEHKSDRTGPHN
jgi:hypothetical protein